MKWHEYVKWLDEKKNREEKHAKAIVEEIARVHNFNVDDADFFPRKRINRIEFDLLVKYPTEINERNIGVTYVKKTKKEEILGVEFKEEKLLQAAEQAIIRRPYVDYIYVAIRTPLETWNLTGFFQLLFYGVGLVGWTCNGKALCLVKSYYSVRNRMKYFIYEDFISKIAKTLHKNEEYFDKIEKEIESQQKLDGFLELKEAIMKIKER